MTLGFYNEDDAKRIKAFVDAGGDDNPSASTEYKHFKKPEIYLVRLLEDLDEAGDSLSNYTQAQARVVRYKSDDTLDRILSTESSLEITITNRSGTAWAEDAELWVLRAEAEYVPFGAGSVAVNSGGTTCVCGTGQYPDMLHTLSGRSTYSRWTFSLASNVVGITTDGNGVITVYAGSYTVVGTGGAWTLTLTATTDYVVKQWDGTDVTGSSSPSVSFTFEITGTECYLKLDMDATVDSLVDEPL
jgi:hypothetical protein